MKVIRFRLRGARSRRRFTSAPLVVLALAALFLAPGSVGAGPETQREEIVTIPRTLPPAARPDRDRGAADSDAVMERMTLPLRLRAGGEEELAGLLSRQQDPSSPDYHRWLTPEEFGQRFGLSASDTDTVITWLKRQGFQVEQVARGRGWVNFTGTVGQVEQAFETSIRKFEFQGRMHQSNATEIALPVSIARLIAGPVPLDDFHSRTMHRRMPLSTPESLRSPRLSPLFDGGSGNHYLAPLDFATIYNSAPLFSDGITGTGVKIAVAARTNIHASDVTQFRSQFGLPANDPKLVINGKDPGIVSDDEEGEAELDTEWSGAGAPGAEVDLVISADTDASDGIYASSQYIVDNNLAAIATVSFGLCEEYPETMVFNALWEQAASQGISVFVAAGDDGVAECEDDSATMATHGASVNGLCSTPFDVCVGGTQFLDTDNPSQYWASSNDPTTQASAISYIPEATWNESGGSCGPLCASGGGASVFYAKPAWQVGPGVPADNSHRYVPDLSVNAGTHDAYLTIVNGMPGLTGYGGTSVSTPALAGILALVVQRFGAQGNPNPRLYQLAAAQFSGGGSAIFHDVTQGDNSVPGQTGFTAGTGYDEATGLGSVDAAALLGGWASTASPPRLSLLPLQRLDGRRQTPRVRPFL